MSRWRSGAWLRVRDPKNGTERLVVLGAVATPKSLRLLRVLGHRDPRSTQGYAALHNDQVRALLEQGA